MKNVTLSADEHLIEQARKVADAQHTTLNAAFREWLKEFARGDERARRFDEIMERTRYLKVDRKYSREELNER